jgi:membrane protein YqaA with SNARE-associated domain
MAGSKPFSAACIRGRSLIISVKMRFFSALVHFLFHLGYFGPFVMGILDSSFLFLPFGNDFLVVGMVARHHHGIPWYVLSAAIGSTVGVCLVALVSRKLGEEGIRKMSGDSRYEKLKNRIGRRSGIAVALAALAPPPFPFTTVVAAAGALGYPLWKILSLNFLARGVRFTILAILAFKFGQQILRVAKSSPFEWSMAAFIVLCIVASGFSVAHWLRKPQPKAMESGAEA